MNPLYQTVFSLTRSAITGQPPEQPPGAPDWTKLHFLFCLGKLHGIVYKTVARLPKEAQPPTELLEYWKSTVFQRGFRQLASTQELRQLLQAAARQQLFPVVFKGLPLALLYPEPSMRFSSDTDLFITPDQRSSMEQLLTDLGYTKVPEASKEHVPVYSINTGSRSLTVELHDCLWEDYTGIQADLLQALDLTRPDTLLTISPFGFPIRTLGYEEHLIYQIFHIAKHFSFEGLNLRFLTDLTLFVNAYKEQIDFTHFWDIMERLNYSVFCGSLFKLCCDYLGMSDSVLAPEHAGLRISEPLLEDILLAGKVNSYRVNHWASTDTLAAYFMRNTKVSSGVQHKLEIFFPMPASLKDKFSYAKKCPLLLPIAWIHRFFSAIRYSIDCKKKKIVASDVLSNTEYRLSLMKSVGLVETK